ncbi:MAG: YfhO family protein, partial [Acetatifactor sp.]|nr:YfhO family protein [Acetatifactor sp.]
PLRQPPFAHLYTMLAVVLETGINTYNTSVGTTSRSAYLGQLGNYEELYDLARQREADAGNDGIFRVEKFARTTKNDGTLAGYPTASVFSSTMNSTVADLYERLGMRHSKVYYCYDGATAFLSALLNVNYLYGEADEEEIRGAEKGVPGVAGGESISEVSGITGGENGKEAAGTADEETKEKAQSEENSLYSLVDTRGRVALYACEATLPFGYVAPVGYDLPEGHKGEPLELQNEMVRLLGVDGTLLKRSECKQTGEKVTFTTREEGYYYMLLTGSGTKKIAMTGALERKYSDLKIYSVLYVGYLEKGRTVTFSNDDDSDETPEFKLTAYRMDEEVLKEALEVLGDRHLEQVTHDDTHVSGKLELAEAGRLILSIPYERGWTVKVNGEIQEPVLVGECLMALDLEPGSYQIDLKYVPYGLKQGILLSAVSILTFAGIMLLRRRKGKEGCPVPNDSDRTESPFRRKNYD